MLDLLFCFIDFFYFLWYNIKNESKGGSEWFGQLETWI